MKVFASRCYVSYGIISTVEKGNGRFTSESPTWIIIKEKPLAGTPGVKYGEKEDTENRSG